MGAIENKLKDLAERTQSLDQELEEYGTNRKSLKDHISERDGLVQEFENLVSKLSIVERKRLPEEMWRIFGDKYRPRMIDADYLKGNVEIIKQLIREPVLKCEGVEDLKTCIDIGQTREYHAGDIIFEEGSKSELIFFLISGRVIVIKDGRELMTLHRTGDVFGEMGPISGKARSASVKAVSDVSCIEIDLSVINEQSRADAHMFRYLIFRGFAEILSDRLRHTTKELVDVMKELKYLKNL